MRFVSVVAFLAAGAGCIGGAPEVPTYAPADHSGGERGVPAAADLHLEVPPPPFSKGIFPCSDCHDDPKDTNPNRRVFKSDHKKIILRHDEANRWCLDCHDANDRDKLRLASGKLIPFEESYRLCGQCHGDKYRDWRVGVHGRRSGNWNGRKTYLLCAHCHDPHSPRFKPIQPKPAPTPPTREGADD